MFFINFLFIFFNFYVFLFSSFIIFEGFSKSISSFLKFDEFYNFIPFDNNVILILLLICYILVSATYYKLFRMFSPRWRVFSANRIIKKIRKGISENKFSKKQSLFYLKKIDPFVFEELLLSLLYERGFKIKRNKRYTGDGGSDGLIWINGCKTHIQAKRYKSYISKAHMKEFSELISRDKTKGIFIHTGKTGKQTKELAEQKGIFIISGEQLISLLVGESVVIFNQEYKVKRKIKNK